MTLSREKAPGFVFEEFGDRWEAAKKLYALVKEHPSAAPMFIQSARIWMSTKATQETHEYKLPAALFEDVGQVSPEWRPYSGRFGQMAARQSE